MPKAAKARLDKSGLTGLGLEKLVEILLDEASVNKALKSRLLAALAGGAGAEEVARLIDKKLETFGKSRGYLSPTRANTLSVELRGLLKNITAELAGLDRYAAFERTLRFLAVGAVIEQRARKGGARLARLIDDARDGLAECVLKLEDDAQTKAVALLEKARAGDDDGRLKPALLDILCRLQKPAADAWKALLTAKLERRTDKAAHWRNAEPVAYLQRLAARHADVDAYIELELLKPQERRDSHLIARMLHEAKRYAEALEWIRKPAAAMRLTQPDERAAGAVQPPRLLEAAILDDLKRKEEAQAIRWKEFERTLRPDILRAYIARLDDFAEFEETDRALALVAGTPRIHEALDFLIKWPRRDLASDHVLRHLGKWDGRQSAILTEAAGALSQDYPAAATVLYRTLIEDILRRGASDDYGAAATHYATLHELRDRGGATPESHQDYVADLRSRYARKFVFWQFIPRELR